MSLPAPNIGGLHTFVIQRTSRRVSFTHLHIANAHKYHESESNLINSTERYPRLDHACFREASEGSLGNSTKAIVFAFARWRVRTASLSLFLGCGAAFHMVALWCYHVQGDVAAMCIDWCAGKPPSVTKYSSLLMYYCAYCERKEAEMCSFAREDEDI